MVMKNKTLIILFAIMAAALMLKFGLSLYVKFTKEKKEPINQQEKINTEQININYNFTFDNLNYEFLISKNQIVEQLSTGKIDNANDKYIVKQQAEELASLTFLPKDTEKYLDQTYNSYLEEVININGLNGSLFKNNGQIIAYLLRGEKYDYLWINNNYVNFEDIVKTFKNK